MTELLFDTDIEKTESKLRFTQNIMRIPFLFRRSVLCKRKNKILISAVFTYSLQECQDFFHYMILKNGIYNFQHYFIIILQLNNYCPDCAKTN